MFTEALKCSSMTPGKDYTLDGLPPMRIVENAIYLPRNPGHYDNYLGIFDQYGRMVNECSMFWSRDNNLSNNPQTMPISSQWDYHTIDSAIYCGCTWLHYGHTLFDFIARLWPLRQNMQVPKKILVHSEFTKTELLSRIWFRDLLSLVGIEHEDLLVFDVPVRIKRLFAPNPGIELDSYVYRGFVDFCHQIGDAARRIAAPVDYPVYLSRRNLNSGTGCINNENELVSYFHNHGIREVIPEHLSVIDQMAIFSGKYPVLGISGSAFHTSIYSRKPKGVGIHFKEGLFESFFAIDRANNADIDYFYAKSAHMIHPCKPGFTYTVQIENIKQFAQEVMEAWHSKYTTESTPKDISTTKEFWLKDHENQWIKVMKHNGEIVASTSFGLDKVSCMAKLIQQGDAYYLTADYDIPFPIFANGHFHGHQSIKIQLEGNTLRADNGSYMRSPSPESGMKIDFNASAPEEWEQFILVEKNSGFINHRKA